MGSGGQAANFEVACLAKMDWRFGRSAQIRGRSFSKILYPAGTAGSDHMPIDTSEIDAALPGKGGRSARNDNRIAERRAA